MTNGTITFDHQLTELDREIAMRERLYPAWIDRGTLNEHAAERQLERMRAARDTVRQVRQNKAMAGMDGKRIDQEAIDAAPELKGMKALVLYFNNDQDRDEMIEACKQALPNARTVKV